MSKVQDLEMVLLDLDGTLLNDNKKIGNKDLDALHKLGCLGKIRAVATGRTFYHSIKVLEESVPIDYLIFSSGAGIYDWKNKEMLFKSTISKSKIVEIADKLVEMDMNFSVHKEIPNNHKYNYFKAFNDVSDFDLRNSINCKHGNKALETINLTDSTQILIISSKISDVEKISKAFPEMKVIRASSPIDGKSTWIEIFNTDVSKAKGAMFLCDKLNISQKNTLSIGNDYNDSDLLAWANNSYVVANSPNDLKQRYTTCCSNNNNPLTDVLRLFVLF